MQDETSVKDLDLDNPAEVETQIRDLTDNIQELRQWAADNQEVTVQDTSKRAPKVTIYSMATGEPLSIPVYMLQQVLRDRDAKGNKMFTGRAHEAPEYKLGTIKCFLHPESEERQYLAELGLSMVECPKATLTTNYSKRIHEQHRHPQQRAALDEHLDKIREDEWRKEQRQEREERRQTTEAMVKLAEGKTRRKAGD